MRSAATAVAFLALIAAPVGAQDTSGVIWFPEGHTFRPLRADPREPSFFAAYLSTTALERTTGVGSVGLGENIGLVGHRAGRWDLSVQAGAFSQFDMRTPSYDLLNTDFTVGGVFGIRVGRIVLRTRLYHQSSHLGDEYLLSSGATRVNLSYESVELLASRDVRTVRLYGGGEYLIRHDPSSLEPGILHGGVEWMPRTRRAKVLGRGAPFAALDVKSFQDRKWSVGWGARIGWEFTPVRPTERRCSIDLRLYDGPSPYGQYYQTDVTAVGAGINFSL